MKRQLSLFLVAAQFLTRLPLPPIPGFQPSWLSRSARYFPLIGALIGLIGTGVLCLSSLCFPPAVAVGLTMSSTLLLTGALHEDGFADVCDGFGGGTTRERVLDIMKDSGIGAFGAIGIGLMLAMKFAALISLPFSIVPIALLAAHPLSRLFATALIWCLGYARAEGK